MVCFPLVPTSKELIKNSKDGQSLCTLQIISNGYAYEVDGDVFYAVDKCPNYGMLSGQRLEHNRAGERVAVDSRKRHPADFALWKVREPLPVILTYFSNI